MRLKLVNTTAFRLSLVYALLFSIISAVAVMVIYVNSSNEIRKQTDYQLRVETEALLQLYSSGKITALTQEMNQLNTDGRERFFLYALLKRSQRDLAKEIAPNKDWKAQDHAYATVPLQTVITAPKTKTEDFDQPARILLTLLPDGYQILVGTDLFEREKLFKRILNVIVILIVILFTVALIGGALMGYSVLRRINNVRQTAGGIIDGDLSQRMQVTQKNDEFDRLSTTLNTMLSRIEQLMQSMHQVTDNLAHDLRNPLNRLRNRLEVSLIENLDKEGYQQVQQEAIQDIDDIIRTFNSLLSIAQAESGKNAHDWSLIDLKPFLDELTELYSIVAEESNISFTSSIHGTCNILGDHQLLAQAFTNLLDNAVKFTPKGGAITLSMHFIADKVVIEITDSGIGIPVDKREKVFERFTRLDSARSTPGNGLGLSLVKAVVERHHGTVELVDNRPGLRVVVTFDVVKPEKPVKVKALPKPD
ncbi:sensor histidine kinase [Leucothrix arctica]|uniref:histidine kinase n=1 Tax=Leucothrix arctica TaxID=1481894 RepID=A0A317CI02_9GAMM|nr:ATP-binding protein [Leucothrix arctica]PWQ95930.1 two-component sensor histidine kinase [Leucothrix arctica]